MTNFKTEIEEIEKRFDEKFSDEEAIRCVHLWGDDKVTSSQIKAFLRAELPSLLSKFAAEVNGGEKKAAYGERDDIYVTQGWNLHHRSVAEKAEKIIKEIT